MLGHNDPVITGSHFPDVRSGSATANVTKVRKSIRRAAMACIVAVVLSGCTTSRAHDATTAAAAASTTPSANVALPTPSPRPGVPAGFQPVGFSAIDADDFWVLGYVKPSPGDGFSTVPVVLHTTDGGVTFDDMTTDAATAPDAMLRQALDAAGAPEPPETVSALQFADSHHGWLFGGELEETDDGGATWTPRYRDVPGTVSSIATAPGSVWAVVAAPDNMHFSVYHATYPESGATGEWARVNLPLEPASYRVPDVIAQGNDAYLLASPGEGPAYDIVRISGDGVASNASPLPCTTPSRDATVSTATTLGTLWLSCATTTAQGLFVSDDFGKSWKYVYSYAYSNPELTKLGGISSSSVAVANPAESESLDIVHSDGTTTRATTPGHSAFTLSIDFTDPQHGLAIVVPDRGLDDELWRTVDGGAHWSEIDFTSQSA